MIRQWTNRMATPSSFTKDKTTFHKTLLYIGTSSTHSMITKRLATLVNWAPTMWYDNIIGGLASERLSRTMSKAVAFANNSR